MPTATSRYFHSAVLRQRFIDALDEAFHDNRLHAEQRLWLQDLARPLVLGGPDPVRADCLMLNQGTLRPFGLCTSLLLSHGLTDNPEVYLFSLAHGVEAFGDRHAFLTTLRTRFAHGDAEVLFEYQKIDGDPFRAQTLAIVEHEVQQLAHLSEQLKLTPTLLQAVNASVTEQLRQTLPSMSIDPQVHLLQIVGISKGDVESTPVTQTLTQATLDDFCNLKIEEGFQRRFLDTQGRDADAVDSALFPQAMSKAANGVTGHYRQLLRAYWDDPLSDNRTRRELAILNLQNSVRRDLYRHSHDGTLDPTVLSALTPLLNWASGDHPANTAMRCHQMTVQVGSSTAYTLAGTFAVRDGNDLDGSLLWFGADHRLHTFSDMAALARYFETPHGRQQLRPGLAIEDQPVLQQAGHVQLELTEIRRPVFADRVDSIIALQSRNFVHVTGLHSMPLEVAAMIDDALDIRQLLDPRQLQISAGRWRQASPFNFHDVWLKPFAAVSLPTSGFAHPGNVASNPHDERAGDTRPRMILSASWLELAQALDGRAKRLRGLGNMLLDCAEHALQPYVCVLIGVPLRARDIRVQWLRSAAVDSSDVEIYAAPVSESQQLVSMDVVSLLLERVSGHRAATMPAGAQVRIDSAPGMAVPIQLVNYMLDKVAAGFDERYVRHFKNSRVQIQRYGDRHIRPTREAFNLREDAIRLDLALGKRQGRFDGAAVRMVCQVLDRPIRSLRTAMSGYLTEAFTLSLVYDDNAVMLCDTLVIRQPLKQDSAVMLWRGSVGWRKFASIQALQEAVQLELRQTRPGRWLALVSDHDRALLKTHLAKPSDNQVVARLERIDAHAIEVLQQAALLRQQQALRRLCLRAARCRFEAGLFSRLAHAIELSAPLFPMLDGLSLRIADSIFAALMPSWLTQASMADLKSYYALFKRFYLASDGGRDFLFDVPSLQTMARQRLMAQLRKDFPDQTLDPDQISVTSRRYVSAIAPVGQLPSAVPGATITQRESLTEYAINRFIDARDTALSIDPEGQSQAAQLITPDYLRQLVRGQDVGAAYMEQLGKALSPLDAAYAARERFFIQQMRPLTQMVALTEKIQGKISSRACDFVSRLVDMPDGIAREPVDGVPIIISPLQLIADRGKKPDTVAGVYLICPADPHAGPVVLYAIYHPGFTFREYANRTALVQAMRDDQSLQKLLLERVDPYVLRRYAHGGFSEPHLASSVGLFDFDLPLHRPGPVALGVAEIKGNALHALFRGTSKLLLDMGAAQAVTNEQVDQAGRAFLATFVLNQALSLLPNKLATLVTLWQGHTLLRESVRSISGHHWGKALSEFSAALGVMVSAREQANEDSRHSTPGSTDSELVPVEEDPLAPTFSWRSTSLTAEQRMRLQGLEAQSVALSQMRHDSLLNLYLDPANKNRYAVVAGKVYQIKPVPEEGGWMIIGADGDAGPRLLLDSNQHWQLDLNLRLAGGGGIVASMKSSITMSTAEDVLSIEATGMAEIRSRYRAQARHIEEAHVQARHYLENCLDNLHANPHGTAPDPRVATILGEFFGTSSPDGQLLTRVESTIKTLFDELMDPSLSPMSSPRFIVGSNRPGTERVTAFVIPADPRKRIFLTERFFNVRLYRLRPEARVQGFRQPVHYQATTLIHELSHLVLDTKDIAYLEASSPHLDLLPKNTSSALRRFNQIERLQDHRLSHRTLKKDLFTRIDNGKWRAIKHGDRLGFASILRITGARTLDQARDIFLADVHKRSQVMLKNADSVALLIARLGRHNYASPNG
ncbi:MULTISPECIES: hypothetical protein [unclassified Pseudomonas]|uniref:hypothetical protein n=1 Tax=unclassified Pseudomonas TaxID=196821 RepID=UPI0025D178D4|nr:MULTISPECIES: hypothetical protein [unclassified Pseudomonas]